MKYENFIKAKELCDQIADLTNKRLRLDNDTQVVLQYPNGGRMFTIGIGKNYEHEYTGMAQNLVSLIRNDLDNKIEKLKSQLEAL